MWQFFISIALVCSLGVAKAQSFSLPTSEGEEVSVHVYPATFADEDKPLLIWFTEGYAERSSFKKVLTQFNDAGYEVWQADLLDSYFIQRSPSNVRKLSGEGVAAVLQHAQLQKRKFIPVSTGRMSLVLLRGARLWQLAQPHEALKAGIGHLQQVVLYFPNLYDAPEKAGDAPRLFPVVEATSLPLTIVQPTEGTYRWKVRELLAALERQESQVTLVSVPNARDWYFLRRQPTPAEQQAAKDLADGLVLWQAANQAENGRYFRPAANIEEAVVTERIKGLVELSARAATDFVLQDISGASIQLHEKQGKVVLLNFWASWCPPCVKEIPSMNRLAQSFDKNHFEIVSVNFKESPQTIRDFLQQVQVDFPVLIDQDGVVSASYEIFSFPSSFLIDAQGQLRYSVNAAIEWDDDEIKKVIEQLIQE